MPITRFKHTTPDQLGVSVFADQKGDYNSPSAINLRGRATELCSFLVREQARSFFTLGSELLRIPLLDVSPVVRGLRGQRNYFAWRKKCRPSGARIRQPVGDHEAMVGTLSKEGRFAIFWRRNPLHIADEAGGAPKAARLTSYR